MKTKIFLLLTVLFAAFSAACNAAEKNDSAKYYFQSSFNELKSMMEGKQPAIFERAVFISENPFHNNQYSYIAFQNTIDLHLFFIEKLVAANDYSDTMNYIPKVKANGRFDIDEILISPTKKKELYKNALNNWAIFTYMEDTTGFSGYYHAPYNYSTADPFGMKDWSNSQLLNLLISENQEGNCFALTAFFKIMADRLKTGAYICTAPQHIYIQHQNEKGNYYNVELATAGHPRDGMLQTLTYTTSTAIQNGISLRSYDDRQSIGLCMVNLAKAYEHKFNTKDDDFLLQCAETVLQNDSLNLNALLLKHQVLNERMLKIMSKNKTVFLSKLTNEQTFKELEKHLARLHRLGYIQMPMDVQEMVLNGFEEVKQGKKIDRNPKPFTIEGVPEEENQFYTMTGGVFQEVFEPKKFEEYGQFTFDTETKTIAAIDTTKKNFALIDPVAFAYDFGARIYDARLGRFMSIDPLTKDFPMLTPYQFASNSPIVYVDLDGLEGIHFSALLPNYFIQTKITVTTANTIIKTPTYAGNTMKKLDELNTKSKGPLSNNYTGIFSEGGDNGVLPWDQGKKVMLGTLGVILSGGTLFLAEVGATAGITATATQGLNYINLGTSVDDILSNKKGESFVEQSLKNSPNAKITYSSLKLAAGLFSRSASLVEGLSTKGQESLLPFVDFLKSYYDVVDNAYTLKKNIDEKKVLEDMQQKYGENENTRGESNNGAN